METLRYVLLTNALLAVVSLVFYGLLRHETHFRTNRLMLWAGLVLTLAIPLLRLPDWRPQPVRQVMQQTARVIVPRLLPTTPTIQPDVTITYPNGRTYSFIPAQQPASRAWAWQNSLLAGYLIVVLSLLSWLGIRLYSLRRLIRQSPHDHYDDFTLVRNDQVGSPFSFFQWVVVNPASHTSDELDQILRHERVHIREWHSLDILGAELVCAIFWFNPAAYLFRRLVKQTLEFRADRTVLEEGVDATTYQYNLVKVSLNADPWALTNSFSTNNLKSRIAMINRRESTLIIWLKYPVFVLMILATAITFGRTNAHTLTHSVPESVPISGESVLENVGILNGKNQSDESTSEGKINVTKAINSVRNTEGEGKASPRKTALYSSKYDPVLRSPSRYIAYKNGFLYWIITPETTIEELSTMKKVLGRHNFIMDVNEVRYDPMHAYIDRIDVTVARSTGGMTRVNNVGEGHKPISTVAGYVGINPNEGRSGTGGLKYSEDEYPAELRAVAKKDEDNAARFINAHRLDYLIKAGDDQFQHLGDGSSTYFKELFRKSPVNRSGINVQADGSLEVNSEMSDIPVYVNNEPVTHQFVRSLTINRLHSVIRKEKFDPVQKKSSHSALLLYVTD